MNPLISVVIPVFNVEEFIGACIDSVIGQTYRNVEIILIDDGSTDSSPDICDKYSAEYNNISVIHQKNAGLSVARNIGLSFARGKYVYFLDSDDCITSDAIERLTIQAEHYHSDVVYFDSCVIGEDGTPLESDRYIRKQSYAYPSDSVQALETLFRYSDYISCVPMMFIRRECIVDKIQFKQGVLYEDVLFTFELFTSAHLSVSHLPMQLYMRRERNNSIMQSKMKEKNIRSLITVTRQIVSKYSATADIPKSLFQIQCSILYEALFSCYEKLENNVKKTVRRDFQVCLKEIEQSGFVKNSIIMRIKATLKAQEWSRNAAIKLANSFRQQRDAIKYNLYLKRLKRESSKKVAYIVGTPLHGNLGDHLIALAEMQLLSNQSGYQLQDVPMLVYTNSRRKFRRLVKKDDIILISGGGWLGTLWLHNEINVRNIIRDFPNNKIVVLPQTVYYEETDKGKKEMEISRNIYSSHSNLTMFLRDEASYIFVQTNHLVGDNKSYYTPDMALAFRSPHICEDSRQNALICFRRDREKVLLEGDAQNLREYLWSIGMDTRDTTTVYYDSISLEKRASSVEEKLKEYSKAKIIVTDRLHSMIFAALAGTPCVAFDNKTHKVSGVYEWMKHLDYIRIARNFDDAKSYINELLKSKKENTYNMNLNLYNTIFDVIGG